MSPSRPISFLHPVARCLMFAISVLSAIAAFSQPTVTVLSPKAGLTAGSPVFYQAYATSPECANGISAMRIYSAPNVDAYTVDGGHMETFITLSPGSYSTVVQAWDNCGGVSKVDVPLTVSDTAGVSVYLPNHSSAYWPVHIAASAQSPDCSAGINAIRIYTAPYVSPYNIYSNELDAYVTLQPGNYDLTVQAWDNCGNVFKTDLTESIESSHDAYLYSSGLSEIAELEIQSDGALKNPNGTGNPPEFSSPETSSIVVDPGGWFLYAGSDLGIYGFQIDRSSGALVSIPGSPFPLNITLGDQGEPGIFMDPAGGFVYVIYHSGGNPATPAGVATYRIERATGTLTYTGFTVFFGNSSAGYGGVGDLVTNPTGQFVYFCATSNDETLEELQAYTLDPNNGSLTAVAGSPYDFTGSPTTTGAYLYLGSSVSESQGDVIGMEVNSSTGAVTQLPGSPFSAGSPGWPISNSFLADWKTRYAWAFEVQEEGGYSVGLQAFTIDSSTGTLTPSKDLMDLPFGMWLAEDHTGSYIFTGGADYNSSTVPNVEAWSILSDGTLKAINSFNILSSQVDSVVAATANPQ
jgi:hypothetical protein